jgi:hypothetical protein
VPFVDFNQPNIPVGVAAHPLVGVNNAYGPSGTITNTSETAWPIYS